jgi:signal transduction histidine kinase
VYRIAEEAVSPSLSVDQMLKRILDLTIGVVGADRGCMLLIDPQTGQSVPKVISFGRRADQSTRMPVSRSIVDYVLKKGQGVRTSDARSDRRFEPGQSILQAGICEAMCVPMRGRYDVPGVIYVDTTTPAERVVLEGGVAQKFSDEQLRLLVAIGSQAALAIENSRYQEALLKAERLAAMGQTIAMLSHHIKNILQGVRGGSYLIDMGLKDHNEDHVRKGWAIVEKNQNKIYQLVMDMLTFSKERQPVMQVASLNQTVGEVCELMQTRAAECKVRLEVRLNESLPAATFDVEGIHRAVLNVVTNAIDAVEGTETGQVIVETGHEANADIVYVGVTDNGPGIPQDQLAKIFNIFESTKGARGTGLGLAVSQKILREHGGDITVETKPGFGCRFVLNWPRIDDEHRSSEHPTLM